MAANIQGVIARIPAALGWTWENPVVEALRRLDLAIVAGAPGPPGPTQLVTADVPFVFSDASPKVIVAVPAGSRLIQASVVVERAFDDPAATLALGVSLDPVLILPPSDIVPDYAAQYQTNEALPLGPDTVILTISPGASTVGSGRVVLVALKGP